MQPPAPNDPKVFEPFMRRAYALARQSAAKGNHPFGALLLVDGNTVLEAENTVISDKDHTSHAEYNLVHAAETLYQGQIPKNAVLVTSTEPCVMCAGALYWSGIRTIVFGCSALSLQEIAGRTLAISAKDVFKNAAVPVQLIGPLLENEGKEIHTVFWKNYVWKETF